jgi:hypothetical protein
VRESLGILVGAAYSEELVEWDYGELSCILARVPGSLRVGGCQERLLVCDWRAEARLVDPRGL